MIMLMWQHAHSENANLLLTGMFTTFTSQVSCVLYANVMLISTNHKAQEMQECHLF